MKNRWEEDVSNQNIHGTDSMCTALLVQLETKC